MKAITAAISWAWVLPALFVWPDAIAADDRQATIVVDAVSFLHDLPQHDVWIDAGGSRGGSRPSGSAQSGASLDPALAPSREANSPTTNLPTSDSLFNRCGIVLQSEANLFCVKEIPEPGTYYLFVRSQGTTRRGSFRVSIGSKMTTESFGSSAELTLAPGGAFALEKGPVEILITRIHQGAVFNALFLTKQPDLKETDLAALEFSGGQARLLKEYNIGRGTPKFGDIDGDGKADLLVIGEPPGLVKGDWRGDGSQVLFWHKFKMNPDASGDLFFPDTVIHMFDFDGNGTDDVIARSPSGLRVYTCAGAQPKGKQAIKDPNILRWKVANHTHY